MAHALALGRRGLGQVWPWPSVGCVIVNQGRVVGRGTTDRRGTYRHAEIVALAQAGEAAKGADVYVTLEPCAHHGTTPPCADALIAAGVTRVVVAVSDPNPVVGGQGINRLQDAGITVETGVEEGEARRQHRGFFSILEHGRPALTLKLATTLDGRIATATGESRWITGPEARRRVHAMRLAHDAVMVGGGTARADNPTLTVRDMGAGRQPVRIVVSRRLDLPDQSRLTETASEGPIWLIHGTGDVDEELVATWRNRGAELIPVDVKDGQLDPAAVLKALGQRGVTRVFCEGGGTLAASFLNGGFVDDLVLMSAGKIIGAEGMPSIGPLGLDRLAQSPAFALVRTEVVGGDVMQVWRRD